MLDIALIRRDPELIRESARRRGGDPAFVDRVLELDSERRRALTAVEALKAEKNSLTEQISRSADKAATARERRPAIAALDAKLDAAADEPATIEAQISVMLADVPNVLDESVPTGASSADNVALRSWGVPRAFDFAPKPHWELGEALGILDFERAAKLSGSRFSILKGAGARLQRALAQFFLDRAAANGYTELSVPYLVSRTTMWSTGQLSKFADAMFSDAGADLFLIPTAEVPLAAYHKDEILAGDELPRRYCAHSACFRKEAGSAGKDTRGLIRQHQFEKVELVWLTTADRSFADLDRLTAQAEELLRELGLPYRTLLLCSGDVGFSSAKTFDLEVWLPSDGGGYREISSCSNCTDFQARRSNIRFRREPKAKPEFVHTLNGSGLAIGRTLLAVLENYQRADGGIDIPDALVPFAGFNRIAADGSVCVSRP